jgi:hypothetical protein
LITPIPVEKAGSRPGRAYSPFDILSEGEKDRGAEIRERHSQGGHASEDVITIYAENMTHAALRIKNAGKKVRASVGETSIAP